MVSISQQACNIDKEKVVMIQLFVGSRYISYLLWAVDLWHTTTVESCKLDRTTRPQGLTKCHGQRFHPAEGSCCRVSHQVIQCPPQEVRWRGDKDWQMLKNRKDVGNLNRSNLREWPQHWVSVWNLTRLIMFDPPSTSTFHRNADKIRFAFFRFVLSMLIEILIAKVPKKTCQVKKI